MFTVMSSWTPIQDFERYFTFRLAHHKIEFDPYQNILTKLNAEPCDITNGDLNILNFGSSNYNNYYCISKQQLDQILIVN